MDSSELIGLAAQVAASSIDLERGGRHQEAVPLMQQAQSAALIAASDLPSTVELKPRAELPDLAHPEHLLFQIGPHSVRMIGRDEGISQGSSRLRRLNLIGTLCGAAARTISQSQFGACVVDIGDGSDQGDYRRFAFSSAHPQAMLLPDPFFFESRGYEDLRNVVATTAPAWRNRRDVIFWRGGASGVVSAWPAPGEPLDFGCLQRLSLCASAGAMKEGARVDVGLTSFDQISREDIRNQIRAAGLVHAPVPKSEFIFYRYLIDIDGNSNSWSLFEKMVMGATILKVASPLGFRQWYYDRLVPWEHYVPVAADLSDFEERVNWVFDHPAEAEKLGANAAELARSMDFLHVMLEAQSRFSLGLTLAGVPMS